MSIELGAKNGYDDPFYSSETVNSRGGWSMVEVIGGKVSSRVDGNGIVM